MKLIGQLEQACIRTVLKLSELSPRTDYRNISYSEGLKETIITDPIISLKVNDDGIFEASEDYQGVSTTHAPAICEARLIDYILGSRRVKAQYRNLLSSKESDVNSAWLIVTAYYTAFFSAIELCRLHGIFPIHLDKSDLASISDRAEGSDEQKKQLRLREGNFLGRLSGSKITFYPNGSQPHQSAWTELNNILSKVSRESDCPEIVSIFRILKSERQWINPSTLRNNWNYKRADHFVNGSLAINFRKLLGNTKGTQNWLVDVKHASPENQIVALAAITETFSMPVISALDRITTSGTLEKNILN